MSKKIPSIIFLACLFISLAYAANAQEDFRASSVNQVELCPCSNQAYIINVENTGTTASRYAVIAGKNISEWLSFKPGKFSLAPKQKASFSVLVNSECNIEGSFNSEIFISTEKGLAKSIKQKINFKECYDYNLEKGEALDANAKAFFSSYEEDSYLVCKGDKKTIPILIENQENFANRYFIKLDAPNWATLNLEKTQLEGKKSGLVLAALDTSNAEEGKYNFNLDSITELGKVQRKKTFDVNVAECYSLGVEIGKEEDVICGGEIKNYGVEIKNKGALDRAVLFSIEGAEWASAGNNSLLVQSGQSRTGFLILNPGKDISGKFSIGINAEIQNKTSYMASDVIELKVVPAFKCYTAGISGRSTIVNHYNQDFFPFSVKNAGIRRVNYTLTIEGAPWADITPKSLELNPGEEGNLNLHLNPEENVEQGSYDLKLSLDTGGASYSKNILVKVKKKNEILSKIEQWAGTYKYSLYLALILIALFIIFFRPIKKHALNIRNRYERYRIRLQRKKERLRERKLQQETKETEKKESEEKEFKKEIRQKSEKKAKSRSKKSIKLDKKLIKISAFFIIALAAIFLIMTFIASYFGDSRTFNVKYTHIYIFNFFVQYLYYLLIGLGVVIAIFLLVLLHERINKRKILDSKKTAKTASKSAVRSKSYAAGILIILIAALAFLAYYFGYLGVIKEFFILYLNYIIAGIVILILIILIISFYKPLFKKLREL